MCGKTINRLIEAAKSGSRFGLDRTRRLLDALGSPDLRLKIIHVAGTNGKGSTAEFIACALHSSGKRAGLFTSPQVYSYGEQFRIDLKEMPVGLLEKYLGVAVAAADKWKDKPTAFEYEVAAALYMFAEEGCEYAVVECGLGGCDDATNAIARKEVAVITSVSLEHTAVLGNTITEICTAKSGIIKDCPAVVSALQSDEGREFFTRLGVTFAGEGLRIIQSTPEGQSFIYNGRTYRIKMLGAAQCYNAATAVGACTVLGLDGGDIARGLATAKLAGRCEIIKKSDVTYVLDGSHNPASFAPLTELMDAVDGEKELVFGCLSDKDVAAAARALAWYFCSATLVSPDSWRAMDAERIKSAFGGLIDDVRTADGVGEALDSMRKKFVAVCGSFTLLKEAKDWIEKKQ